MNIIKKIKVCVFLCLLMGVSSSFASELCSEGPFNTSKKSSEEALKIDISKLSAKEVNRKLHKAFTRQIPLENIPELLKHPEANVHDVDANNLDLLNHAIQKSIPMEYFRMLMNHKSISGLTMNSVGSSGWDLDDSSPERRPLVQAVVRHGVEYVEEMLKHKQVDVNIRIKTFTPIFYKAVEKGNLGIIKAFLKRKDLKVKEPYLGVNYGQTPLKRAKEILTEAKEKKDTEKARRYKKIIRKIKKHQRWWKKWILASSLLALIENECSGDPIGVDSLVSKIGEMNTLAGDYKEEMSDFLRENGKEEVCDFLEESKEEVSDFLEESKEEVSSYL